MLVTIYIPTKDRVDSLARSIESVLNQTYRDIELIVINDGSTDATEEYLADLSIRDARVRTINNSKSHGAPAARNLAVNLAQGHFVTGLDDDDCFEPQRISAFVAYWELLVQHGITPSCLYTQDRIVDGKANNRVTKKPGHVEYEDLFDHNYLGNQIFAPRHHLVDAGLFDEELPAWQDLEFFMRVLKKFGTAYLLDMATHVFDDSPRPDRISQQSRHKLSTAFRRVVHKHAPSCRRQRQRLFLQIFDPYYGFRPCLGDWIDFTRDGIWLVGMLRLAKAAISKPYATSRSRAIHEQGRKFPA